MKKIYFFLFLSLSMVLVGCQNQEGAREYTEIVKEEQAPVVETVQQTPAKFDMSQMPDDDIHAAFKSSAQVSLGEMPKDDIHAGLNVPSEMGQMPEDDIHAGLSPAVGKIPEDDIHAGLRDKMESQPSVQSSGMSMPTDPSMAAMLQNSVAKLPLSWTTPKGWIQKPASGMRLATFVASELTEPIEVSIISLGGASDVPSNAARWLGQVGLSVSDDQLTAFVDHLEAVSTQSGQTGVLIDATTLQGDAALDAPSLIGAIIDNNSSQIFIKMTGVKRAVSNNKDQLRQLIQSMTVN